MYMTHMLVEAAELDKIEKDISAFERYMKNFPDKLIGLGIRVLIAAILFFIGAKLIKLIRKLLKKSLTKANAETGVIQFMDGLIKVLLYFVLILIIASNFGFDATSVVALLGSAGVTIGLALQGSLSNLAGGVLILILKPFRVGDYIKDASDNEGTVKMISIFYTKLVTIDQKVVILPNGALANGSITNYSESEMRKLDLRYGISYDSDIKKAKSILETIVQENENIDKTQPIQIFVHELASSEITLGVRCFCENTKYWDTRWKMNEDVKYAFDEQNIEIPFPQVSVHMEQ